MTQAFARSAREGPPSAPAPHRAKWGNGPEALSCCPVPQRRLECRKLYCVTAVRCTSAYTSGPPGDLQNSTARREAVSDDRRFLAQKTRSRPLRRRGCPRAEQVSCLREMMASASSEIQLIGLSQRAGLPQGADAIATAERCRGERDSGPHGRRRGAVASPTGGAADAGQAATRGSSSGSPLPVDGAVAAGVLDRRAVFAVRWHAAAAGGYQRWFCGSVS
jgi:hypothetical protein